MKGAQEAFLAVLQQIPQPETRKAFLTWVDETWIRGGKLLCMYRYRKILKASLYIHTHTRIRAS